MPTSPPIQRDKEFRKAWRAAKTHLKSFDNGDQVWLRSDLRPPITEHLSFSLGKQLFSVFIETGEYQSDRYKKRFLERAAELGAVPCVIRMQKNQEEYIPTTPGWGLLHAENLEEVTPDKLVSEAMEKLTAQETHVIAVNAVVDRLKKDGNRIRGVSAYPPTWPSIRFESFKQECWAIAQSKFGPIPYDIGGLLEREKFKEQDGYLAEVEIIQQNDSEDDNIDSPLIFRGHEHQGQVTKVEKIYDHKTGECKILDALRREIEWYHRNRLNEYEHREMGQGGTEHLISRSRDPVRMRAFLLVSVFLDRLIYNQIRSVYEKFEEKYKIPKLIHHVGLECISSNWFIYSTHGYDEQADWNRINLFARRAKKVVSQFLQKDSIGREIDFDKALAMEIRNEFEDKHQTKLLNAFEVAKIIDRASRNID